MNLKVENSANYRISEINKRLKKKKICRTQIHKNSALSFFNFRQSIRSCSEAIIGLKCLETVPTGTGKR